MRTSSASGSTSGGALEDCGPRDEGQGTENRWVFYLLDALRLFRDKSLQEIQEITFEIGMLGKYWLDINDSQESHVLPGAAGEGILSAAADLHHVMWIKRSRARSRYRGGAGRQVESGVEAGEKEMEIHVRTTPRSTVHTLVHSKLNRRRLQVIFVV